MTRPAAVRRGSGNVFEDLGTSAPDENLAKDELVARIASTISRCRLTRGAAARVLGIDPPKVSALVRSLSRGSPGQSPSGSRLEPP